MANTVIQLKYSSTPSSTPSSLANGELAINYADGKLYYKNLTGQIVSFSSAAVANVLSFATVNANGSLITAAATNSILTISNGDTIEISGDIINDIITIKANLKPAFDRANSKTYTFYQSSAPATSNAHDFWVNSNTGVVYENFGTTSSPIWAEFGPSTTVANLTPGVVSAANLVFLDNTYQTTAAYGNAISANAYAGVMANSSNGFTATVYTAVNSSFGVINAAFGVANSAYTSTNGTASFAKANGAATNASAAFDKANTALQNTSGTFSGDLTITGNTTVNKQIFVSYRPASAANAAVEISAANTKGGTGYADVLKITNIGGGITNPAKWIRINSTGALEVVNSSYNITITTLTDAGNLTTTGTITPGAWTAGQVIKDTMLSNSEFSVLATTVATSTSDTDFISYSYTPVSSSSYLVIHVHVGRYDALTSSGTGNDSYFSRIKVDGNEIVYAWQYTRDNYTFRTGTLFPLTGRYTNSNTAAKTITVGVRRDTADDNITITNSPSALWMRITEIAR